MQDRDPCFSIKVFFFFFFFSTFIKIKLRISYVRENITQIGPGILCKLETVINAYNHYYLEKMNL